METSLDLLKTQLAEYKTDQHKKPLVLLKTLYPQILAVIKKQVRFYQLMID